MSALALVFALLPQGAPAVASVEPAFELVEQRAGDWNRDGKAELLWVGRDGRVRTWSPGAPIEGRGELVLADRTRTALDLVEIEGAWHLVEATPRGTFAHAFDAQAAVLKDAAYTLARAKLDVRTGVPVFAPLGRDVNRDGRADLVLPTSAGCELWMATAGENGAPQSFRRTATIAVEISRSGAHEAKYLSDGLESSFSIPGLDTRDVNGDGRPDLLVEDGSRRGFHLQREDGSLPLEPDVEVDLSIFKDSSSPDTGFEFGAVISGSGDASYEMRDLDGDAIPDFVIAQGRKVWVFRGTPQGPQFREPSDILKAAEDITALFVIELDDDDAPELVLFKVQIPTLATILRGLYGEWDVSIGAAGYKNSKRATFEKTPAWKNELTLRLPGIIGVAKNPGKVLERFSEVGKRFRTSVRGDLDGDGLLDVALVTEDQKRVEIWRGREGDGDIDSAAERRVRDILFDQEQSVWDLERLAIAVGDFAQRQVALLTRGRPFEREFALRDPAQDVLADLEAADFDGDGRAELLVSYRRKGASLRSVFDVVPLGATKEKP